MSLIPSTLSLVKNDYMLNRCCSRFKPLVPKMVNVLNKSTNPRFRYSFGKTLSFFFRAPNFILGESLSQYDNQGSVARQKNCIFFCCCLQTLDGNI